MKDKIIILNNNLTQVADIHKELAIIIRKRNNQN